MKKSVDMRRRYVVFYSSAQGTEPAEAGTGEGAGILKTIQRD